MRAKKGTGCFNLELLMVETPSKKESMTLREVTRAVISLVEKGAAHVLMPISARKQLNDLPDDVKSLDERGFFKK